MDEKIKISLPKSVLTTLKNDCKNFNILKADGSPNFNAFINTLITNYYEAFSANEETLHDDIKKTLQFIPERFKEETFTSIVKIIAKKDVSAINDDSTTFSFKPTRSSEKAISFIENVLLSSESLSSFYRRLFISYVSKTQPQRELIVFKKNYELLQRAVKKGVCVYIATKSDGINDLSVYGVFSAKEELYNYVLATDGKKLYTIRLANVKDVSLLSKTAFISPVVKNIFDRQIRCGVQYPIYEGEENLIKVKFTARGLFLFKKIYLYRPTPVKIENDIYSFDCSTNQAVHYFKRLGLDAIIIEPKEISELMRNFYSTTTRKYNNYLSNNRKK